MAPTHVAENTLPHRIGGGLRVTARGPIRRRCLKLKGQYAPTSTGSELVVAWQYGDKVDKIGTASDAIGQDGEVGSAHFWAG